MDSVAELLRQFAFIGAVLAGFAVTFLVGLFNAPSKRRSVDAAAAASLVAAAFLILSTVTSVIGVVYIMDRPRLRSVTIPSLPNQPAVSLLDQAAIRGTARWAGISFLLGMAALLVSLGLSGWIRSRKLGVLSSLLAGATLLLLLYFLRFVVHLI